MEKSYTARHTNVYTAYTVDKANTYVPNEQSTEWLTTLYRQEIDEWLKSTCKKGNSHPREERKNDT